MKDMKWVFFKETYMNHIITQLAWRIKLQIIPDRYKMAENKQSGKKIAQYLSWKGCHTVAIYGMGYMGQTLADELTDGNVKVLYGIDQNAGNLKWKIKICQPSDKIEPVDLIVNTTAIDNSIILHGMEEKNIPMAAFDELLDQILTYTHCIDGNNQIEREE